MGQTFTDNCFDGTQIAQTSMQNMETNFATLRSSFSGSGAPANQVSGNLWFDTDDDQVYIRNKDDDQWLTLGFIPGTLMLFAQATSPTGWTKKLTFADTAMLTISSDADGTALGSGGSANPQATHSHTMKNHTHTGASHNHKWYNYRAAIIDQTYDASGAAISISLVGDTSIGITTAIGGDQLGADAYSANTTPGASGAPSDNTSDVNAQPKYQEVIICEKD